MLAGRTSALPLSATAARLMVSDPGVLVSRGRTYTHTGFTGTSLVLDEDRDLVAVLLTNRVHPSRTWSDLTPFRQELAAELTRVVPTRR